MPHPEKKCIYLKEEASNKQRDKYHKRYE